MVFPFPTFGYHLAGAGGGAPPNRSLDFEASSLQSLSMSGTNFGVLDSRKWTCHFWFKLKSTGSLKFLVHKANPGFSSPLAILLTSTGQIDIRVSDSGGIKGRLVTTGTWTSTTTWHQLVVYWDSANATEADRLQLWVDGSRITTFNTNTQPAQDTDMNDSTSASMFIGAQNGSSAFYDGLLYQLAFFDNALPDIATLHNSGSPVDLRGMAGSKSLLHTNDVDDLTDDYVLAAGWTNTNGVAKSTDIPA